MSDAQGIGDRGLIAYVHCGLANVRRAAGAPGQAIADLLAALEIYEEIGDRWGQAACLATLCWSYADLLDTDAVARYAEQGRSVAAGCNPRAFASLILAESVLARRTGEFATADSLGTRSVALFGDASLDLYGAWAQCELQATRLVSGQDLGPASWAAVPARATGLTQAAWLSLRAASVVSGPAARAEGGACIAAAAAARQLVPASSPRVVAMTTVDGLLAAAAGCLAWDETLEAAALAPFDLRASAPGVVADYRLVLDRIARTDLTGSDALREALGGLVS